MKLICIKNRDDSNSIPWTRNNIYYELQVGKIYEGKFIYERGSKWAYIKELNFKFSTHWWFAELEEYRKTQLDKILNED